MRHGRTQQRGRPPRRRAGTRYLGPAALRSERICVQSAIRPSRGHLENTAPRSSANIFGPFRQPPSKQTSRRRSSELSNLDGVQDKKRRRATSLRWRYGITYGVVLTVFTAASAGKPWAAMKKLWSYMLRYMRPVISAALGPKVGRPPCKNTTTTTRPTLVLA
jgi:hypothetical protein